MIELALIPDSLSVTELIGLTLLSAISSFLSTSIGIGGGLIMLATMAQLLPIKAIIPVHGIIQLGSNTSRAVLLRQYIHRPYFGVFILGSLVGVLLGGQLMIALPVELMKVLLGVFILVTVWAPTLLRFIVTTATTRRSSLLFGGFFSTFLTMFVGATGPFVLALLKLFDFDKLTLIATCAAYLVFQHGIKVLVFGILGFAFADYLFLVICMVMSGFIGTLVGRKVLIKIDPARFKTGLNIMLTLLALRLMISAIV